MAISVAVLGGGNGGHAAAAGNGTVEIAMVTSDLKEAITGVKYIFVAVLAFAHDSYAEKLSEVVQPGQVVTVLPGTFDSLIFWKAFQEKGIRDVVVAETNTLPYATSLKGPGEILIMSRFNPGARDGGCDSGDGFDDSYWKRDSRLRLLGEGTFARFAWDRRDE